ncbi:ABC transporter permease [Clostridium sp. ZS2-4]|uniref:ABC transporter permease n=1 Tax=Clostridium sp. ZS2-4 TaxID=2987703 RepID=UPI00227B1CDB|nr:ABC transporter permease [Clostridium sp. ZS2-4]MCY6356847.1 ABC transporter permease [Clostridium sp. ZS2-4]
MKSLIFPIFAIIVSIFVAVFFVMWSKGYPITQYFSALTHLFSIIWQGSFATERNTLTTITYVTPLIFTGIAHSIAFRCGLFNIGAEGQFIMGMIAGAILGLIPGLNPVVHAIIIIIGGIVIGALWGGIPGILKAKFGTNEVINTIMMNYIGMFFANWIIKKSIFAVPGKSATPIIQDSAKLMPLRNLSKANISIFIAIIFAIFIYWLLWKTTIGYEIRGVGINPLASEYGGINVPKNIVLAMVLSGALAGIGGATHVAGITYQCQDFMAFPNFGFDGIAVALLAKSNPVGCIASAILFGALKSSATMLQFNDIPKEIVFLIQSIIIIFVATDYIVKYFADKKKKGEVING